MKLLINKKIIKHYNFHSIIKFRIDRKNIHQIIKICMVKQLQ